MIAYISIGNSDDKLTQREWSDFIQEVGECIDDQAVTVHGVWFSSPGSQWQNACWCADFLEADINYPKGALADLAKKYRQDSIAWAPVATTEFLGDTDA